VNRFLLGLFGLLVAAFPALADLPSGTNAVTAFINNGEHAADAGWSFFVLVGGALFAVGVLLKFTRKAGGKTS